METNKSQGRAPPLQLPEESYSEMGLGKPLVSNGEYFLRMSFLLQAAALVPEHPSLQRHYTAEAKNISKRQVLRIDPLLKSEACKRCQGGLLGHPRKQKGK